jgi:hypothetical protein
MDKDGVNETGRDEHGVDKDKDGANKTSRDEHGMEGDGMDGDEGSVR